MNFFCKLLPPRSSFAMDMTEEERGLMGEHAAYWSEGVGRGNVIAFGLVADPAGAYGIGIVEFESEEEVRAFTDDDPTIRSGQGFEFEIYLMPLGVARA
jgi:hypothetical protein